jgi:hypothetical protein
LSGVISIFVSSTFRDFHAERDVLNGPVRQRLNELVEPFGARVEIVDLRWGVDTAQLTDEERHNRVLDVCLAEIDRCRPLFVGMLGDRVGWRPPPDRLRHVASAAGLTLSDYVTSVTALEFEHVLAADADPVFFKRTIDGPVPAGWVDEDPAPLHRLEECLPAGAVHRYSVTCDGRHVTNARAFEDLAYEVLEPRVAGLARSRRHGDEDAYAAAEALHLTEMRTGFADPWGVIDRVVALVEEGERVYVDGPSGSGKSAVWAAVVDRLRAEGRPVATHVLGAGAGFHSHDDVVRRLIRGLGGDPPEIAPYRRRDRAFQAMLARVGIERPSEVGGEALLRAWAGTLESATGAVVAVDGLDRMEPSGARTRLDILRDLGDAPCVVTTADPDDVRRLAVRGFHRVAAPALGHEQAVDVIGAMTAAGHRQLSPTTTGLLAERQRGPLWLRLALDEFHALGEEEFTQADGTDDYALERLLQRTATGLPQDVGELVERVRLRAQRRFGQDEVLRVLGVVCAARYGVRRADLTPAAQADDATVAGIVRMLSPIVTSGLAGGRVAFRTSFARDAMTGRLGELILDARIWLAEHIGEMRAPEHTDLLELLGQSLEIGNADSLADVLRVLNRASRHRQEAVALAGSVIEAQAQPTAVRTLLEAEAQERSGGRRAVTGEAMSLGRDPVPVRDFMVDLLVADALPQGVRDEFVEATGDGGTAEALRELATAEGTANRAESRARTRRLLDDLRDRAEGTKFPAPVMHLAEGLLLGAEVARALGDRADEIGRLTDALRTASFLPEEETDQSYKVLALRALDGLGAAALRGGDLAAAATALDDVTTGARAAIADWPAERIAHVGYVVRLRGRVRRADLTSLVAIEAAQLTTLRRIRANGLRRRLLVALRQGERDTAAKLADEFAEAGYAAIRSGAPNAVELEPRCAELAELAELAVDAGELDLAIEAMSMLIDDRYLSERGTARRSGVVYGYGRRALLREHAGRLDEALSDYGGSRVWSGGENAATLDPRTVGVLLVAIHREERAGPEPDGDVFEEVVLSATAEDGTLDELLRLAIEQLESDAAGSGWSKRYSAETLLAARRCLHRAAPASIEATTALVDTLRNHAHAADEPRARVAALEEACAVAESFAGDTDEGDRHHQVARVWSLLATAHAASGAAMAAADSFDRMIMAADRAAESLDDALVAVRYRLSGVEAAVAQAEPGPRADALRDRLGDLRTREAELVAEPAL